MTEITIFFSDKEILNLDLDSISDDVVINGYLPKFLNSPRIENYKPLSSMMRRDNRKNVRRVASKYETHPDFNNTNAVKQHLVKTNLRVILST